MRSSFCLCIFRVAVYLCISCLSASGWGVAPASSSPSSDGPSAQSTSAEKSISSSAEVIIPGPLRSFLRMAGISQKASPEEVLPLLARNVFLRGYEGSETKGRPTEFLILLSRYVQQARELATLAGQQGVIHVSSCDDAKLLLRVLGYQSRQGCGQSGSYLETADPDRAFLTIDSGFPLLELEQTLAGGKPFAYAFPQSRVPVLFTESDWIKLSKENKNKKADLLDTLLRDPVVGRLYWGLARIDTETRVRLRQSPGLKKLLPVVAVLDFYGSHISIRSGHVIVPGGTSAESAWKDLVGASPESPDEFVERLLAKDKGWLAAYFDALSRVHQTEQAHFTQANRLRRNYEALRGHDLLPDPARPVFRPNPGLLLLVTRIRWEPTGEPRVPGNLEVWKEIFRQKGGSKFARAWSRRTRNWTNPEDLVEGMFALSRVETDIGPLEIYLMLSELDGRRSREQSLSPETVRLLADKFPRFSNQYLIFSEFPDLNDRSITRFLNVAEGLNRIPNHTLRGNAMGTFQANVGLWQILARQGQIVSPKLNDSWQRVIEPFARIGSSHQLFDAGSNSLAALLEAVTSKPRSSQDEIIDLLAGPQQATPEGQRMHQELANRIRSVLDGQRLVSLDTLLALGTGLSGVSQAKALGDSLVSLAGELREFEMPQPIFRRHERDEWAAGMYNNRHTEIEMRTDLTKIIKASSSPEQLAAARGQLASFLRDTLVGLNYAYYEPPGSQILHNNPLFVRSHDFSGDTVSGLEIGWQAPQLFGAGSPAGGGAHLVGSLADLPYVLAEAEEDFISPENVQALVWKEVVPGLLTNAITPRWWGVSRNELHAVALYQRAGEELLTSSVNNEKLRRIVVNLLSDHMLPESRERVEEALEAGQLAEILPTIMPADTFYLTGEFRQRFPEDIDSFGAAGKELEALSRRYPAEISWERLAKDFGVPHPVLARTYTRELLHMKPFPAFMGYSSRLLAESWESSNLYWARLADEMGYSPVMLNRLVPELTRRMIEKIFATDLEDWPALLRATRETGEEFRHGKIASLSVTGATSGR